MTYSKQYSFPSQCWAIQNICHQKMAATAEGVVQCSWILFHTGFKAWKRGAQKKKNTACWVISTSFWNQSIFVPRIYLAVDLTVGAVQNSGHRTLICPGWFFFLQNNCCYKIVLFVILTEYYILFFVCLILSCSLPCIDIKTEITAPREASWLNGPQKKDGIHVVGNHQGRVYELQ